MPINYDEVYNLNNDTVGSGAGSGIDVNSNWLDDAFDYIGRAVDIATDIESLFRNDITKTGGTVKDTVQSTSDSIVGTSISNWFTDNWFWFLGAGIVLLGTFYFIGRK